ncbi:Rieske (2Fe-2S) domain protein [metagenome]|uniref:Rieske (2Fe-2S) domain protein n=1 Tax=metagenome TaxID=256318 RepID=A0A2P2C5S0_9ZZZZ
MTNGISRRNALAGAAVIGVAAPTLAACGADDADADSASGSGGSGSDLGTTADIPEGSGVIFSDAGVVVTQPAAGEFKGFSNICTHQKCPVASVTDTINCTCHGSKFSINDGSNVAGPSGSDAGSVDPLPEVAITVDGDKITKA